MSESINTLQLQSLQNRLFTLTKEHGHCDVLLDQGLGPVLEEAIQASDLNDEDSIAIVDPMMALEPEKGLRLLRLTSNHIELLDATMALAFQQNTDPENPKRQVCAWLFGDGSLKRTGSHLKQWLDVAIPEGERIYFRYYDPRVTPHLPRFLDTDTFNTWLYPLKRWTYLSRDGELKTFTSEDQPQHFVRRLDAKQWAILQRLEVLNLTIRALAALKHPVTSSEDEVIDRYIERSIALGFSSSEDQLTFALHAQIIHPEFDRHPRLATPIQLASQNKHSLSVVLDELETADLDAIRNDMNTRVPR